MPATGSPTATLNLTPIDLRQADQPVPEILLGQRPSALSHLGHYDVQEFDDCGPLATRSNATLAGSLGAIAQIGAIRMCLTLATGLAPPGGIAPTLIHINEHMRSAFRGRDSAMENPRGEK